MTHFDSTEADSLDWVRQEIERSLEQAREKLEAAVAKQGGEGTFQPALSELHQVRGSLQMIELYGAALIAEEIEAAALALAKGKVNNSEEVFNTVVQAITELPGYLDELQQGSEDIPLPLLPMLDSLRNSRGEDLLSERLFNPDIYGVDPPVFGDGSESADTLKANAIKLALPYQMALLNCYRNNNGRASLERLLKIIERLAQHSDHEQLRRLWWFSGGVVESFMDRGVEPTNARKRLLGRVERYLNALLEKDETSVAESIKPSLLKALLYVIAHSTSTGPRVSQIRQSYGFSGGMGARELVEQSTDDPGFMKSVVESSLKVLEKVRKILESFSGGITDSDRLMPLADMLDQVADTLEMLGLGRYRRMVAEQQLQVVQAALMGAGVEPQRLRAIAGALGYVESSLGQIQWESRGRRPESDDSAEPDSSMTDDEQRQLHQAVLREVKSDLEEVKELLSSYYDAPDDFDVLSAVPQRLDHMRGGLIMLEITQAVELLETVNNYIRGNVLELQQIPEQSALDDVAEVLSGVEYFIEGLEHSGRHSQRSLGVVEQADIRLNALVTAARQTGEAVAGAEGAEAGAEEQPKYYTGLDDADEEEQQEIIEIFLEEADEQLEVIGTNYPRWKESPDDHETLTEIRRSFHTLKGSGRMAGAASFGDFAWAVENLLNQVLREGFPTTPALFELMDNVIPQLPQMVTGFREQGGKHELNDVQRTIVDQAHAMACSPDAMAELPSPTAAPPVQADTAEEAQSIEAIGAEGGEDSDGEEVSVSPGPDDHLATLEVSDESGYEVPPGANREAVLVKIFHDETVHHLATIDRCVAQAKADDAQVMVGDELITALHTLHGSADMADYPPIATIGGGLEHLMDAVRERHMPLDDEMLVLLEDASSAVSNSLGRLQEATLVLPAADDLMARIAAIRQRVEAHAVAADTSAEADAIDAPQEQTAAESAPPGAAEVSDEPPSADQAMSALDHVEQELASSLSELAEMVDDEMGEELDRLADEAVDLEEMVATSAIDDVAPEPEPESEAIEIVTAEEAPADVEATEIAVTEVAATADGTEPADEVAHELPVEGDDEVDVAYELDDEDLEVAREAFMEEAEEIFGASEQVLHQWQQNPADLNAGRELEKQIHTFKGGARMAGFPALGDLSHSMESLLTIVVHEGVEVTPAILDVLQHALDALQDMFHQAGAGESIAPANELIHQLESMASGDALEPASDEAGVEAAASAPIGEADEQAVAESTTAAHVEEAGLVEPTAGDVGVETVLDDVEALLEEDAQREGASAAAPDDEIDQDLYEEILDTIASEDAAGSAVDLEDAAGLDTEVDITASAAAQPDGATDEMVATETLSGVEADDGQGAASDEGLPQDEPAMAQSADSAAPPVADEVPALDVEEAASEELIRVSAGVLDKLVNLAAEASVSRSRLEQNMGSFRTGLGEMERTVTRLREQLRRLEIETEAQILFRHEEASLQGQDFDPLEFDRFSLMQQLSRSLQESADDLMSIEDQFQDLVRGTETIVLQQGRTATDLQEGLMRTRFEPVSKAVPRLRRVVRQTTRATKKKASLTVQGADQELDRTLMNRMLPSLEHMLRNAIDHGIEPPETRATLGKPEAGEVVLSFDRQGNDIIIRIEDDGRGLDVAAIRERAVSQGLIAADADLNKEELLTFVLQSGFSTAASVTQISGRGVGMDVANSEIKQLGGTLHIDTTPGQGTRFTIHVPLTIVTNFAVLVEANEEQYAIPFAYVDGVTQADAGVLASHGDDDHPELTWGQRAYKIYNLSEALGDSLPAAPLERKTVQLLLVRTGEHHFALQVDRIIGNREIVVKPVGPQLSAARGLAGATIMADGRVALVIDASTLIQRSLAAAFAEEEQPSQAAVPVIEEELGQITAMVVDDSITVRKITSRLLNRHGINVVTAKDGVDALEQLQHHQPDIILLDIEMPRMDGFELASLVRNDQRLAKIPIIMITSRIGDKHRDRALELGVNRYLGKPFQEEQLLESINTLTGRQANVVQHPASFARNTGA